MKKVKLLFTLFTLMFISINTVHAECTNEEIKKFQKMINNIEISYEYNETSETENLFIITVSNIPKEIKIYENRLSYIFKNNSSEEYVTLIQDNMLGGTDTNFVFYTTENTNCPDLKLNQKNIKLPVYNKFWQDELCKDIEEYDYCHKIIANEITYEGFKKNVLKYKESLNEITEITNEENLTNNILKQIKDFINENKTLVIISSSLLLIILFSIILKKKRSKEL